MRASSPVCQKAQKQRGLPSSWMRGSATPNASLYAQQYRFQRHHKQHADTKASQTISMEARARGGSSAAAICTVTSRREPGRTSGSDVSTACQDQDSYKKSRGPSRVVRDKRDCTALRKEINAEVSYHSAPTPTVRTWSKDRSRDMQTVSTP